MSDLTQRYAKALFELDKELNNEFDFMIQILNDNPQLIIFFQSSSIDLNEKKSMIASLFNESEIFKNFLNFLIQRGKLSLLSSIAKQYRLMVNKSLGIWEADIVTAVPLDEEIKEHLKQKLEEGFHKKMTLHNKVNPKIIGGVILIVGNTILDWSVTNRLKKLKENFT